jgi:hypothetical protein
MHKWVVVTVVLVGCAPGAGNEILTFDEIASACAAIRSCTYDGSNFAACVGIPGSRAFSREFACFARVRGDCDAALACVATTRTAGVSCPESMSACEGDVIVSCTAASGEESEGRRTDCAALGLLCIERSAGGPACGLPCTETACMGSDLVECTDRGDVYVCPAGTECDGTACAPLGPDCTESRCEGDNLIVCGSFGSGVNREYAPFSCASWGAHCGYEGGDAARCIPDGDTCDPRATEQHCEGESIVFCGEDWGVHSFDCTAHGYLGCSGGSRPYCVPRNPSLPGM